MMAGPEPDISHLDFEPTCELRACDEPAVWVVRFGPCKFCGDDEPEAWLCHRHGRHALKDQAARHTCGKGLSPITSWRDL